MNSRNKELLEKAKKGSILSVGEFILEMRLSHQFSQSELARALGVSQSNLSKIENNLAEIRIETWFNFCRFVEIPFETYEFFLSI